jgi:periplasmic protein TonB
MFEIATHKTGRPWIVALAMLGESLVIAILVSMPLMRVQEVRTPDLASRIILLAPPPSPPPPPLPVVARQVRPKIVVRKFDPAKLTAPTIANEIAPTLPQAPEIAGVSAGVPGGVPGGIPGGVLGGVPGGVLGGILNSVPSVVSLPPLPAAEPSEPAPPSRIRIGGNVQASLLLYQVTPLYPKLAAHAHIGGTVRLKAVIGCDGKVKELTLISGHPLLVPAAEEAVKQWIYRPTLLNGLPYEVDTEIDVNFKTIS